MQYFFLKKTDEVLITQDKIKIFLKTFHLKKKGMQDHFPNQSHDNL